MHKDTIQLDISHRYYGEIKLKGNEETYLRFLFNINVQDVGDIDYTLKTVPSESGIKGTSFDVEIARLPQGCQVSSKHVLTDTQGSGDIDGVQLAVVADMKAGPLDWAIKDPKITVSNIQLDFADVLPYWSSPMVLLDVEVTRMSQSEYLTWLSSVTPPTPPPGEPGYWEITVPGGYEQLKQSLFTMFPEFEAEDLHYRNPYLGQPGGPYTTVTVDVAYLKEYVDSNEEALHLEARGLKFYMDPIILPSPPFPHVEVAADDVQLDIDLNEPDPETGVFGEATARLSGNVVFHIPNIPPMFEGYDYEGPELNIHVTFVEPEYEVIVDPSSLRIPIGQEGTATVTVNPTREVSGTVTPRWECDIGEIEGWFDAPSGGTPPFTTTLHVNLKEGFEYKPGETYYGKVVAFDFSTGKSFGAPVEIAISPLFEVTVDPGEFTIQREMEVNGIAEVTVTPTTEVSNPFKLWWDYDVPGLDVWLDDDGGQPPFKTRLSAVAYCDTGTYEIWLVAWDENMQIEYRVPVTITVEEPKNIVDVAFEEYYVYRTGDDYSSNVELTASRYAISNLYNREDGTHQPVINPVLTLDTGLEITGIDTENLVNPEPYESPFTWVFDDIQEHQRVSRGVGIGGVSFTPGFAASRTFDYTIFEADGVQELTINIVFEAPADWLDIEIWTESSELVDAMVLSGEGFEISPDGQHAWAKIENPTADVYTYHATIKVTKKTLSNVEYKPRVCLTAYDYKNGGQTVGSSVSWSIPEIGDWAWSATGEYSWHWAEHFCRVVDFETMCQEVGS